MPGTIVNDDQGLYRASKFDCTPCPLKTPCYPKEPVRKIPRSIFERSRDVAPSLIGNAATFEPVNYFSTRGR